MGRIRVPVSRPSEDVGGGVGYSFPLACRLFGRWPSSRTRWRWLPPPVIWEAFVTFATAKR